MVFPWAGILFPAHGRAAQKRVDRKVFLNSRGGYHPPASSRQYPPCQLRATRSHAFHQPKIHRCRSYFWGVMDKGGWRRAPGGYPSTANAVPLPLGRGGIYYLSYIAVDPRGEAPKRRLWRMKRGGFEEVSRLAATNSGRESADTTVGKKAVPPFIHIFVHNRHSLGKETACK